VPRSPCARARCRSAALRHCPLLPRHAAAGRPGAPLSSPQAAAAAGFSSDPPPAGGRCSAALCPARAVRAPPSLPTSKTPPLAACLPGAPVAGRHP